VLPIPNEAYAGPVLYDANDPAAVFPPIQEVRPPKGAPNVLIVLIDGRSVDGRDGVAPLDDLSPARATIPARLAGTRRRHEGDR
jgi:hypothetical protein